MITVRGNAGRRNSVGLGDVHYDYNYPNGLNLKPGSPLSNKILDNVVEYARLSYDVMKRRHPYWKKIDHTLTAYITLDDAEALEKKKDERKPVAIVVPYSYATLETLLTYLVTVFLENPIFKYSGFTDEDVVGTAMLEKIIELQCIRNKVALSLHTMLRDSLSYGIGITSPYWMEQWGKTTKRDESGAKVRTDGLIFEGNALANIDPYNYLPDPSVPIQDTQRGSFVGWINFTNYTELMGLEEHDPLSYNAKYVAHIGGRSSVVTMDASGRETKVGGNSRNAELTELTSPIDEIVMFINIIPKEWGLGKGEYPEKWLFRIAGDEVVLEASPVDLDYNKYPVTIAAPEFDGYSLTPVSSIEMIHGLQEILDFLFTSHVANIRKALNDMLIVDPYLINMSDLAKPGPGKLIRTRRAVWGRGVENAVKQLAVTDVTRGHMADAPIVMDIMSRGSGAADSLMGIMRGGSERRSATEARATSSGAISRLAKNAKVISLMAMQDLAHMFASNTQQFMTQETYVSVVGRYQQQLEEEFGISQGMKATPGDLLVNYDVVSSDGTTENGDFVETWTEIFRTLSSNPAVGGGFDIIRVFKHLARMTGAKNVNDFVKKGGGANIKMMQDAEVQSEVQSGNLVPVGGANAQPV